MEQNQVYDGKSEKKSNALVDIYDGKGSLVNRKSFDMEYTDIIFDEDEYIIYSSTEFSINNMRGVERFTGKFEENVYLLTTTKKRNRFVVMTQDAMKVMEMK